ncbi:MAG TPA: deoxyribonuclease IV [Actinobacteria bacterium]|nr:deoxyribonuclease IV [Actinomycetota bacterium]
MLIGAHVPGANPIEEAAARNADVVQIFLSNPQSWKKPLERADAAKLASSGLPIYVHAPYLINVVSPNNRVRIPSRNMLADTVAAAASIGSAGVIVHGGHVTGDSTFVEGLERWRKALEPIEAAVPVLIENTAGGGNAMARRVEDIALLWEAVGAFGVGFCLDTCHAWAAGEDLDGIVDRIMAATGRIDLIHLNDSRDPFDSRRDRHANLGEGEIPAELLVQVVREAGAPAVVETPGGTEAQAADIAWIRERLQS